MCSFICSAAILSVLVVFVGFSEGKFISGEQRCFKKLKITKAEYEAKSKNYDHTDPIMQCVMACFMENMGRLEHGKLSVDKELLAILERVPSLKADASLRAKVTACVNQANRIKDKCEKVHTMMVCAVPFTAV